MTNSEISHDVVPVNSHCSATPNKTVIAATSGTTASNNINNVSQTNDQLAASAQYDNVGNISVKPMYGGNNNKYKIKYRNKEYNIISDSEVEAIKSILKNKVYKTDSLLEINNSLYVIRANYKNKFKKIH
jgi:proline racemase